MEQKDDANDVNDIGEMFEWKVSKEEYDDPSGKNYVHPEARQLAEQILAEWKKPDGERMVLLKAQMQCGKTSIIRHLYYLLNVEEHCNALGITNDSTFVLSHLNDNSLVMQTAERLQGVMIDPIFNVFHPAKRALKPNVAGNVIGFLTKNRVLICDESHYGTGSAGRIDVLCHLINSPLWYDKVSMKTNNTFVLLISATPFAELGVNTEHKMVVDLLPSGQYWGIEKMLTAGKIYDNNKIPFFKQDVTAQSLDKVMSGFGNNPKGFIIIRENVHSKSCVKWMSTFKAVLANATDKYGFFELNEDTCQDPVDVVRAYGNIVSKTTFDQCRLNARNKKLQGVDAVLDLPPPKTIFIFIKEMLLAGKTLNTTHVLMVIDFPYQNNKSGNVDRIVQGLTGRCCGYNKNKNVVIVSNKPRVQSYIAWVQEGTAPALPATHAKVQGGTALVAVKSAYVKPLNNALQDMVIGVAQQGLEEDYQAEEGNEEDDDDDDNDEVENGGDDEL